MYVRTHPRLLGLDGERPVHEGGHERGADVRGGALADREPVELALVRVRPRQPKLGRQTRRNVLE